MDYILLLGGVLTVLSMVGLALSMDDSKPMAPGWGPLDIERERSRSRNRF